MGLNSCVALRKSLIGEANWKENNLLGRNKDQNLKEWKKKVMWSDEPKFNLFQSDGHILQV